MARSYDVGMIIKIDVKTEFWFCPLCDDGAHIHSTLTFPCGAVKELWVSPDDQPVVEDCRAWCQENEPVDPKQAGGPEPWDAGEGWRSEEDDPDFCGFESTTDDPKCANDPDCAICMLCTEHCEC